ncbi:MAG TPA: hypothetical protein VGH74_11880, partial [Planctomycetaceae bacterium]
MGRLLFSAQAKVNQPQAVPDHCLQRIAAQNLFINPFGLFKLTGLLKCPRTGQRDAINAHWNPFQNQQLQLVVAPPYR